MSELTDRIQEWSRRNGYIASGLIGPLERDVILPWHEAQVVALRTRNGLLECRVKTTDTELERLQKALLSTELEVQSLRAGSGCALCDPTEVERLKAEIERLKAELAKAKPSAPRLMRCPVAGQCAGRNGYHCLGDHVEHSGCAGGYPGCPACVPVTPEPERRCEDATILTLHVPARVGIDEQGRIVVQP